MKAIPWFYVSDSRFSAHVLLVQTWADCFTCILAAALQLTFPAAFPAMKRSCFL